MWRSVGFTLTLLCASGALADAAPKAKPAMPHKVMKLTPGAKSALVKKSTPVSKSAPVTKTAPVTKFAPAPKPVAKYLNTPSDMLTTPAYRYGQLSRAACEAELTKRHITFKRQSALGVLAPVRLLGPLHGVLFRTELPEKERARSPHEIADCRLVLALDDFTEVLRSHDVIEVRHYSMYRLPPDNWPRNQAAEHHPGAMALDAGRFVTKDGTVLDVDRDFNGAINAKTCGPGAAPRPATEAAKKLRAIVCETVDRRLFNVVLTPNYNAPHKNHFHLEVTAGVKWFLVH